MFVGYMVSRELFVGWVELLSRPTLVGWFIFTAGALLMVTSLVLAAHICFTDESKAAIRALPPEALGQAV